jgi:hypothetical protein
MVIAAQSYNLTVRFNAVTVHTVPLTAIVILTFRLTVVVLVLYHFGGSMELNARILLLAYMLLSTTFNIKTITGNHYVHAYRSVT